MDIILKKDIKKGTRFYWNSLSQEWRGFYEIICFRKDLSVILCHKESGVRSSINTEEFAKFDERIIRNGEFWKAVRHEARKI